MPIPVISKLKPINDGAFPVVEDIDIQGGYQVRDTLEDLNSIPEANKKAGMLVYVVSESKYYTLSGESWSQAELGGATGPRFNNSPNTHIGNMFVGPTNNNEVVEPPGNKSLFTKIGAFAGKIIYDPTIEILDGTAPIPRRGAPTQKGPYAWFIRLACNDIIKFDTSTSDIFHISLDDIRRYSKQYALYKNIIIGDGVIDFNNQKFYALEFLNRKVIKIDAFDLQVDKIIDLPDFEGFTLPIFGEFFVTLLARFILFDPNRNKSIIVPNLFSETGINFWSLDSSDSVSTHTAAFEVTPEPTFFQVEKAIIADDYLWVLAKNFSIFNDLSLHKISLDTMEIVATYNIDISETEYSSPDNVVGTKLVKHPTLPYMYMLNANGYLHKIDLDNNTTVYYSLGETLGTPEDMTFDQNTGCLVICENVPEIIKVFDLGVDGFTSETFLIETDPVRKNDTGIAAIEYIPELNSSFASDVNNDMILGIETFPEGVYIGNAVSVIGLAEWKSNENIQSVTTINDDGLTTTYSVLSSDQVLLVNNSLNETGGFTTVDLYLDYGSFTRGSTITIKDISGMVSGTTEQPLIRITSNSGYIDPNIDGPYNNIIYIHQALCGVTLTYDGDIWRITGSYVPNPAILVGSGY